DGAAAADLLEVNLRVAVDVVGTTSDQQGGAREGYAAVVDVQGRTVAHVQRAQIRDPNVAHVDGGSCARGGRDIIAVVGSAAGGEELDGASLRGTDVDLAGPAGHHVVEVAIGLTDGVAGGEIDVLIERIAGASDMVDGAVHIRTWIQIGRGGTGSCIKSAGVV